MILFKQHQTYMIGCFFPFKRERWIWNVWILVLSLLFSLKKEQEKEKRATFNTCDLIADEGGGGRHRCLGLGRIINGECLKFTFFSKFSSEKAPSFQNAWTPFLVSLSNAWSHLCGSPRFGIAHALCLGLAPWLAAEVPILVDSGMVKHKDDEASSTES